MRVAMAWIVKSGRIVARGRRSGNTCRQSFNLGNVQVIDDRMPLPLREFYYGPSSRPRPNEDCTASLVDFIFDISRPGQFREQLERSALLPNDPNNTSDLKMVVDEHTASKILEIERRIKSAFRSYGAFSVLNMALLCSLLFLHACC